jgi:AAHS family 4-hydroxybenzoate transporter-like MFS transporter
MPHEGRVCDRTGSRSGERQSEEVPEWKRPFVSKENPIDVGMAMENQSAGSFSFLILVLCCAAMVIEGYDVQVLAYAAPAIIRDWQIEQAYFGPVFGAALFGYLLGATLMSGVSDKIGRKKVIVLGNIFLVC